MRGQRMQNENGMVVYHAEDQQVEQLRSLLLPEAYQAWENGGRPLILGLTKDQVAVGALAAEMDGSSMEVLSFYVAPEFRRQGGGTLLMDQLLLIAEDSAEEVVFDFIGTQREHFDLELFLVTYGFAEEERYGAIYATTIARLGEVPALKKEAKRAGIPLRELGPVERNKAQQQLRELNAPYGDSIFTGERVDPDVSFIHVTNQKPDSFFLCEKQKGGSLMITGAWNGSGTPVLFLMMVQNAFNAARKKYPAETVIAAQAVNPTTQKLIRELMPEAVRISHCYVRTV